MKPGSAGTMTHDYKRHGTTTLFAALYVLDGIVIGTRSSCAFSIRSRRGSLWEKWSMQSSTITQPTNIRRCGNGWPGTLPLHPDLGILAQRCRRISPSSRASGSSAAYSSPSSICNFRSNNHCLDARSRSWGRREEARRRYHCIELLAIAVVAGHAWPNETELKFFIGRESFEHDWSARRREMYSIRVRQRHDEPARRLFVLGAGYHDQARPQTFFRPFLLALF
jgi:hypothetical protein